MDFLFVSDVTRVAFPERAIATLGAWDEFVVHPRPDGFLAVTANTYDSLEPVVDASGGATLVQGDPLFDWTTHSHSPDGRTRQIASRVESASLESEALRPFSAAAIVRIGARERPRGGALCEVRIDRTGGGSIFAFTRGSLLAVASSPDLIALAVGATLDFVSCAELVSGSRVTAPFTLYEGIRELRQNTVTRFRRVGLRRRIEEITVDSPTDDGAKTPSLDLARAQGELDRYLQNYYERIDRNVDPTSPITCTLSAGMDSRVLTVAAVRHFGRRVHAVTASPAENLEVQTARAVASALGVPQTELTWNPAQFRNRFVAGLGLTVGSHRRWTDAHFLGAEVDIPGPVIGGFLSDVFLDGNSGPWVARRAAIEKGQLSPDSDWRVTTRHQLELSDAVRQSIWQRAEESRAAMEPQFAVHEDLRFAIPTARTMSSGHWLALQHEWAHYEPFPTERVMSLVLSMGALRKDGLKRALFADILNGNGLADVPINPDTSGPGHGAWLSFRHLVDTDPDFDSAVRAMGNEALEVTGIPRTAVRDRSLLVNLFWANRIVTEFAPAPGA